MISNFIEFGTLCLGLLALIQFMQVLFMASHKKAASAMAATAMIVLPLAVAGLMFFHFKMALTAAFYAFLSLSLAVSIWLPIAFGAPGEDQGLRNISIMILLLIWLKYGLGGIA